MCSTRRDNFGTMNVQIALSLENCHGQFSNFRQFETNTLAIDIKLKTTQFDQSFNNLPFDTLIDLVAPTFFFVP